MLKDCWAERIVFCSKSELKTRLSWAALFPMSAGTRPLPALPASIIKEIESIIEMLSKLHQVIPWWVPTVLLSLTQPQMTGLKTPLQTFLQSEVLVPSGRASWLSGSWAHALDYWSCQRGWDCPLPEECSLCSADHVFRLFSHHPELRGGRSGVASRQAEGTAWWAALCTLNFDIHLEPFFDSPATYPFHLVQNVTSSLQHLRLLIIVPVFTVLLVSCPWTWAGRELWLASQRSMN